MYEVPKSKKSLKQNKFEFKVAGKEYVIPLAKYIDPATAVSLEAGTGRAVREFFDKYAPGAFAALEDGEQLEGLMNAWQAESDITLGESSASSDS